MSFGKKANKEENSMDAHRPLILLVEDNPYITDIILDSLKGYFDVVPISTVEAALKYMATNSQIDVLICDFSLNHSSLDGFDVIICFQDKYPEKQSILFTSHVFSEEQLYSFSLNKKFKFFDKIQFPEMIDFICGLINK